MSKLIVAHRFFSVLFLWAATSMAAQPVSFSQQPVLGQMVDGKLSIDFTVSEPTDIEVAVVCDWQVLRHLAAGFVGPGAVPPAPLASSLKQSLTWDGLDDYGNLVPHAELCWIRAAAGMQTSLHNQAGGDPYFFYSREMGQGDHAYWRVTGLEVKPDGTVYVMGNQTDYGIPAIRQYEANGQYKRTVFPFRGDAKRSEVAAWGLNTRADGNWVPRYKHVASPAMTQTIITENAGRISSLLPTASNDVLTVYMKSSRSHHKMSFNTDSTLTKASTLPLVTIPPLPEDSNKLHGNVDVTLSPDGASFYLSGIFTASPHYPLAGSVDTTGFWRDGQVWKVDVATQAATVFHSIPAAQVVASLDERRTGKIATTGYRHYATFQGVAVDREENVFIADRAEGRILVLNKNGVKIRAIDNIDYPEDVAVDPDSGALYVTTKWGRYDSSYRHPLMLLKFDDWRTASAPSKTIVLDPTEGLYSQRSHLAITQDGGDPMIWVAYTTLPVRVYRDTGSDLVLERDFYQQTTQRFSDVQRMSVDPKTERVFLADGYGNCSFLADWARPVFERCMVNSDTKVNAIGLAIDARNRYLYTHDDRKPVLRYRLDGEFFSVDPITGSLPLTPNIANDWNIGLGKADRGIGVAPDGSLVTLNQMGTAADYTGPLTYFNAANSTPWTGMRFVNWKHPTLDRAPLSGGVRFDPKGNMYVGRLDTSTPTPVGFESDDEFRSSVGRISRFDARGEEGNLFRNKNATPDHVYDVPYGGFGRVFSRAPRFSVDGYGRVIVPSALESKVTIVDNNGQLIHSLGVYGNLDEHETDRGIVMAYPNSVDSSDDFLYVGDIYNTRVLQILKTYDAEEIVTIDPNFVPEPKPAYVTGGNGWIRGD